MHDRVKTLFPSTFSRIGRAQLLCSLPLVGEDFATYFETSTLNISCLCGCGGLVGWCAHKIWLVCRWTLIRVLWLDKSIKKILCISVIVCACSSGGHAFQQICIVLARFSPIFWFGLYLASLKWLRDPRSLKHPVFSQRCGESTPLCRCGVFEFVFIPLFILIMLLFLFSFSGRRHQMLDDISLYSWCAMCVALNGPCWTWSPGQLRIVLATVTCAFAVKK